MTGRIITARHGRPDLSRDVTITAREYGEWWARYDESGLHPDERPPESLIALARGAKTVLSSTLPRAIETAAKATGGAREVPADPIYVEAPLPAPPLPDFLKLKPGLWGVVSRAFWILGYAPAGVEHNRETWARVDEIAARLDALSQKGDVLLCAHGYLNWMIDRRLLREGWKRTEREGGNHYWSWRIYEPAGDKRAVGAEVAAE
ncbi:histidine phosphatase family protein [Hyphococcus luteus]|uniref:Histidine phosphatase family protein n=1 Tax=Hyphococcus luteus TaxID=2058213 RepID=A0A2S7K3H3_9PROT|nr:histidine phosphatase family protein [Marinicaulis flavus]PQA87036.1 histidine phosphatase family protein [Marinicaulis flavus]